VTSFVRASDASLLVIPDEPRGAIAWYRALRDAAPPWLVNLHPAAGTILVELDLALASLDDVEAALPALAPRGGHDVAPGREVRVPVVYDGPDLDDVARLTGLSVDDVARLHGNGVYTVSFLGFSPGFAYLDGLARALFVPRLDEPRPQVPAGSVAIGGDRTAIYPSATPGGWRLIGRTTMSLAPDWVEPGDVVRFVRA
jgi:KipI family sensor histidine kinase inhibitor